MPTPTADEINENDSLDERWALKNFLGKTHTEAEALFGDHQDSWPYFVDLSYMGPRAFCYYVPAAIATFKTDSDFGYHTDYFCSILEARMRDRKDEIVGIFPILREAVQYILDHWDKWDEFDGSSRSLRSRYSLLLNELSGGRSGSEDGSQNPLH